MERLNVLSPQKTCDADFIRQVEKKSGQNIVKCYQCGNCTASCVYTDVYDYPVHQIMRLVQLGQKNTVLKARSIWLCANCQACTTRCPCNIDVAGVMKVLRTMSLEEGAVSIKNVQLFYDEFLNSVKTFGRLFETGLIATYNLKAKKPFTDVDLVPRVLMKGKLALKPPEIKGKKEVADIFERFKAYRKKSRKD